MPTSKPSFDIVKTSDAAFIFVPFLFSKKACHLSGGITPLSKVTVPFPFFLEHPCEPQADNNKNVE